MVTVAGINSNPAGDTSKVVSVGMTSEINTLFVVAVPTPALVSVVIAVPSNDVAGVIPVLPAGGDVSTFKSSR